MMNEVLPLDAALESAAECAFDGERVAVVVHGAPERIPESFLTGLQDLAEARLVLTMPPIFWAAFIGYSVDEYGEYDSYASVEMMTPEYYRDIWKDESYDCVIDAEFPASEAERR